MQHRGPGCTIPTPAPTVAIARVYPSSIAVPALGAQRCSGRRDPWRATTHARYCRTTRPRAAGRRFAGLAPARSWKSASSRSCARPPRGCRRCSTTCSRAGWPARAASGSPAWSMGGFVAYAARRGRPAPAGGGPAPRRARVAATLAGEPAPSSGAVLPDRLAVADGGVTRVPQSACATSSTRVWVTMSPRTWPAPCASAMRQRMVDWFRQHLT